MDKVKELLAKANQLANEAGTIIGNTEATAEDIIKADAMITEAQDYRKRAEMLSGLEAIKTTVMPDDTKTEDHNEDGKFKSFGEFAKATWMLNARNVRDNRLTWWSEDGGGQKAMSEGVGADGGFLVPSEFRAELMSIALGRSVVRPRATVIPMSRRSVTIPVLDQTGVANNGAPNFFGGISARWTEEAAQKAETSPKFRNIELVAHKLALITYSSDELIADSAISLQAFLTSERGFSGAIAYQEDYAFLHGSGAGAPLGVLNSGATITVPRTSDSPRVTFDDLANMMASFLPSANGVWLASQSLMVDLLTLAGPTGNASYLWGNASAGVPNTLLGMPIIFSEKMNRAGVAGDLLLADFSYYLVGDRQNTTIETSIHNRFENDQTTWRAVHRVDGQPWLSAPVTYADGVTQISPFVMLGAKSS